MSLAHRSCAILIIALLAVLSATAQALPGTEKSDNLSGLASETEQMTYCYYTTTVNAQLSRLSPGKSASSSNQAATFVQWQATFLG